MFFLPRGRFFCHVDGLCCHVDGFLSHVDGFFVLKSGSPWILDGPLDFKSRGLPRQAASGGSLFSKMAPPGF